MEGTRGSLFWRIIDRVGSVVTLLTMGATTIFVFLGGVFDLVAEFTTPWRIAVYIAIGLFLVSLVAFLLRLVRLWRLRRKEPGAVLPGTIQQTGISIAGGQSITRENIVRFGPAVAQPPAIPPRPRLPATPEMLRQLADDLEQLAGELQQYLAREPIHQFPPRNLSEEAEELVRQLHDQVRHDWEGGLLALLTRVMVLYEEARNHGYTDPELEESYRHLKAGAAYRTAPARLILVARHIRADLPDEPDRG